MVGPNKQFDQDDVLNKALQVFWNNGYEATSMQDLVGSMGINRASMYQTYGNKHSLFMSSLDSYIDSSLKSVAQIIGSGEAPMDSLQHLFENMIKQSIDGEKHGCFINNTAIELGSHDSVIAEKICNFWARMEAIFETQVKQAIDNNELYENANAKQIASLLNVNLQGLMVKTKANPSKENLFSVTQSLFDLIRKS